MQLRALKVAEANLRAELSNDELSTLPASARPLPDRKKLNAYRYEVVKTRQERNKEMKMSKNLAEKIIETWKELKDLRQKQQFRNTQVKLIIRRFGLFAVHLSSLVF
jgi:hypothetical protein